MPSGRSLLRRTWARTHFWPIRSCKLWAFAGRRCVSRPDSSAPAAVARGRDSFRLALQLCGWNRTVSDIYRLESNRCGYVGKCGSAVEGGPSYSRPGPSRHLRFLADGSADDPPLPCRHSDRHCRNRVSGLRDGCCGTTGRMGELASQHFSDTVQRGFSRSTELEILPDCAHDFYYGLRGHDGYADWSVGTRGISG